MGGFQLGTVIETDDLTLRPFAVDDVPDLVAAADDPEMHRWMPWARGEDERQATEWCTTLAGADPDRQLRFVIEAGGTFAGSIGLHRAEWDGGRVEVGYWLAAPARGKGIATRAARAIVSYAFSRGLHRVELLAATANTASQRVAERAGFTREGVLREAIVAGEGAYADAVLFSRLAGDP